MEQVNIQNGKSQLAKLLATENITVEHKPDAKTAWFDVKRRVLCLPVWREMSNDLYDLLVVHEVGHALDTPADGWLEAIGEIAKRVTGSASGRAMGAVKGFLNVIEDARIDKRQKRRFPGARRNYVKGYQELIEKDFFGTKSRDVNGMSFIDRLNIYCKGGSMLGIKFSPEEKKLLAKVEAAETFDEVLALTEEIFRWSKERQEEQEQNPEDFPMPSEDGEGEESDEDSDDWSDDTDGNDDGDGEESDDDSDDDQQDGNGSGKSQNGDDEDESDDDSDGDSEEESQSGSGDIGGGSSSSSSDGDDEALPESETEKAWQKNQEDLIVHSNEHFHYVRIPRPTNIDKLVIDYKQVLTQQRYYVSRLNRDESWLKLVRQDLMKFRADENAAISFMVKEFEMRKSADEYARTSVSKTGVIDTNKLHSYKYNDDLFRRITSVATGKNHGFVMFIDWSGSMQQHLKKTLKQLFSLVMFCKRVQIPFEVYSFRSMHHTDFKENNSSMFGHMQNNDVLFTQNQGELMFDNMQIRNLLSSRMKVQELNDAMYHLWLIGCGGHISCDDMSSTPLNECIGVADLIVNKFRARSKVQICNTIFLTDGQSDPIYSAHNLPYAGGKRQRFILQDEITKKSYDIRNIDGYHYGNPISDWQTTTLLLRVLKDRVGGNLIGFYINGDGFEKVHRKYNGHGRNKLHSDNQKSWNSNGFFPVTGAGYDEYYILNPKSFNVSTGNLVIDKNATKNKMAKEFIKHVEKKTVSRVLLSRFVKQIAA